MLTTILPSASSLCPPSHIQTQTIISRTTGLGWLSCCSSPPTLQDEKLHDKVLVLLDAKDLCNLSQCSKALYVLTSLDVDLWRDLALSLPEQQWRNVVEKNLVRLYDDGTTHLFHWKSTITGTPVVSHTSFGVWFSDLLWASMRCRYVSLPREWAINTINAPHRYEQLPSLTTFVEECEKIRKPAILSCVEEFRGGINRWKDGLQTAIKSLCEKQNGPRWRVGPRDMSAIAFSAYCEAIKDGGHGEESPLYVFDSHFVDKSPVLGSDYIVPHVFRNTVEGPYRDLFELLGAAHRPDHQWIILGAAKTGSKWHIDPNKTHAWNACLYGTKKWLMLPPGSAPPLGVSPSPDGGSVIQPVSLVEWFLEFYEETRKTRRDLVEFIQGPGDVVFVPAGTWHAVLNVTDSCAVTQNYVSDTNVFVACQFFKDKPEQISGLDVCERKSGFAQEFMQVLPSPVKQMIDELSKIRNERHGGLGKWADLAVMPTVAAASPLPSDHSNSHHGFRFDFFH